ncbi:MAG: hypothetical protein QOE25_950, partial [Actinomycetota bacterium]|nr:hypothetical protein [Actinomycetota bacterium]
MAYLTANPAEPPRAGRQLRRAGGLIVALILYGSSLTLGPSTAEASTTTFTKIAAGGLVSCAVTTAGAAECWGRGRGLGAGEHPDSAVPIPVSGLSSGVSDIAAGWLGGCAVVFGGVKCWGANGYGELGDGTTTESSVPVDVSGHTTGVAAVSMGGSNACALTTAGGVKCWGLNNYGQAGNGTLGNAYTPVDVSGLSSGVQKISAGSWTSCALTNTGGVKCWGFASEDPSGLRSTVPADVTGLTSGALDVSTFGMSGCAVTGGGAVQCWGSNPGTYGPFTGGWDPVTVTGLSSGAIAVSVGADVSCALRADGGVECWGQNSAGQLGDGTTTSTVTPVQTLDLAHATSVSTGARHTCALSSDVGAACWGDDYSGELGNGTTVSSNRPQGVVGASDPVATSSVTLTADRVKIHPGYAVALSGQLTLSDASDPQGRRIDITVAHPNGPIVRTTTTGVDGTFSLTDLPQVNGSYVYTATWSPDVLHSAPVPAPIGVLVWQNQSSLQVTTS